jgi:oligopeptide transport system substrate-binding protein
MKFKRSLALILACLLAAASFASCSSDGDTTTNGADETTEDAVETVVGEDGQTITLSEGSVDPTQYMGSEAFTDVTEEYTEASSAIYNAVLGDFYTEYQKAKEASSVSERYALMAIAEAKLLESGVMLPNTCNGGNYAIGRVAPYTANYALWGNDYERYHQCVVTNEIITSEDRTEMKAKWAELKGTGTYVEWAKSYLTDKGYTIKDSYTFGYTSDPETWDVLATSRSADSEAIINTYDGLLEYDPEGVLQPALALGHGEWSEPDAETGYITVTYKLREGVKWVDSQGREVGEVTADDFVAGMQHMCDAAGGLEYLVQGIIVGVDEYISGSITDFSQVGVTAVDDYTLQYTLTGECSYFETMFGYGVFAPLCRSYYTSQGGTFGIDNFDSTAESYNYGKTPDNIAYCGPYLVTNNTASNTIVFSANESYWNKDNINVKTITWLFNDGTDATKAYNDMVAGTLDACGLNSSALELAKADGNFDKYSYVTSTGSSSYMSFMNVFRQAYANTNDTTTVVSPMTDDQKTATNKAMGNVHFRRALCMSIDRIAQNAQKVGDELAATSVRNTYVPGNFVSLEEDVTVDINGTATTFAAGTNYGVILQAQLDADGVKITAYDPAADDGVGSSDGFDGWYNVENAKAELEQAISELSAQGVEISADNPIYIDILYPSNSETYTNSEQAVKQSIENALGGLVKVNLVECVDYKQWYYAGYYTTYGFEANYTSYDLSGWGPDFGDPCTYLDTFLPDYAGYMVKCIGIF